MTQRLKSPLSVRIWQPYDIEYEPCILALDNATRTAMVKAFLEEVEAAGYYGILYASRDFIANKLNWQQLACYDVWCA